MRNMSGLDKFNNAGFTYPLLNIRFIIIRAIRSVLIRVSIGYLIYYYNYYYYDYYRYSYFRYYYYYYY